MTQTAKHTPGPWTLSPWAANTIMATVDGENIVICEVMDKTAFTGIKIDGSANAHLLAAAPELLEALELFDDVLDGLITMDMFNAARKAAIAKARGQS